MSNIITRNTVIPTKKVQSYTTSGVVESTSIRVFEGERPMVRDNHMLGDFQLTGFPKGQAGVAHDVTFEIDTNGILTVTAEISSTGSSKSLTINNDASRLTEDQIEELIREAERFAEQDKVTKERADAKVAFESYLNSVEKALEDPSGGATAEEDATALETVQDAKEW